MSKKLIVFSFFMALFLISFVSAADFVSIVNDAANSAWGIIRPLAEFLLGASADPSIFMARILIFIILLSLVWFAVKQFPLFGENNVLVWVVSLSASILAVRFMAEAWVITVILPYSALGIALTAIFPLVVYFFFVEKGLKDYRTLRKIAWVFAAVVFVTLFFTRSGQLAPTLNGFDPAYVYLIAAAACIIFLLFDGTIQKWYSKVRTDAYTSVHKDKLERHYRRELADLFEDKKKGAVTSEQFEKEKSRIESELSKLGR